MAVLLKFGRTSDMEELLKDGKLHCKTLHAFANMYNDKVRGDVFETIFHLEYSPESVLSIRMNNTWIPISKGKSQIRKSFLETIPCGNVFCMYAYDMKDATRKKLKHLQVEASIRGMGDSCVVILNPEEFLKRVRQTLTEKSISCESDFVKYKDFKNFHGSKTKFDKPIQLQNQNEYRILIDYPILDTLEFEIGSIEDIAMIHPSNLLTDFEYFLKKDKIQILQKGT